ncbi:unnamed protein product [Protopolystoma xenopodis]|uniref:Uncharacterized protein n=1 Tax=Protopolystoma xenopodis TaxID=117903 RepID=A0A3S5BAX7_9PLAT|nr:unnamed protein product [Protopolystoma xenopodis]
MFMGSFPQSTRTNTRSPQVTKQVTTTYFLSFESSVSYTSCRNMCLQDNCNHRLTAPSNDTTSSTVWQYRVGLGGPATASSAGRGQSLQTPPQAPSSTDFSKAETTKTTSLSDGKVAGELKRSRNEGSTLSEDVDLRFKAGSSYQIVERWTHIEVRHRWTAGEYP